MQSNCNSSKVSPGLLFSLCFLSVRQSATNCCTQLSWVQFSCNNSNSNELIDNRLSVSSSFGRQPKCRLPIAMLPVVKLPVAKFPLCHVAQLPFICMLRTPGRMRNLHAKAQDKQICFKCLMAHFSLPFLLLLLRLMFCFRVVCHLH